MQRARTQTASYDPARAGLEPAAGCRLRDGVWARRRRSVLACIVLAQIVLAAGVLGLGLSACASTPPPRPVEPEVDLHHPDPGRRALAVQSVAAAGDTRYIADLIELLDDRDESVRLVAGGALTQMTGRDGEYRAFAPREERLVALDAWRTWYETAPADQGRQP